jgi:hypothetical protein
MNHLRTAGPAEQATELTGRVSAAGLFELHLDHGSRPYRFGREPDGHQPRPGAGPTLTDSNYGFHASRAIAGETGKVAVLARSSVRICAQMIGDQPCDPAREESPDDQVILCDELRDSHTHARSCPPRADVVVVVQFLSL